MDRLVDSMKDKYSSVSSEESNEAMEKLKKLKESLDIGAITEDEFKAKKANLMDKIG